jgi:hypothetical protein
VETTLHRELKERYGSRAGGRSEVVLEGFRVDAVTPDGVVIEVQSGPLGPLRTKLDRLLPEHHIRVIKPVILARRVVRRTRRDGADLSARFSPKKGDVVEVFDDLIGLARVFPHPNLQVDVLGVEIDEVRIPRRRWPGYAVVDRRLREVSSTTTLRESADLLALLPGDWPDPFTTRDLADRLRRPLAFAQRVAYCLRHSGAVKTIGKLGNHLVYAALGAETNDLCSVAGRVASSSPRPARRTS